MCNLSNRMRSRNVCRAVLVLGFGLLACGVETSHLWGKDAEHQLLTDQELADGWISLFDGQTFFGWRPAPGANWRIADGALVVDQGEVGLLCTTTQFSDYVLKVDYQCDTTTNSGLFLRTAPVATNVQADCYELNIAPPDNPFPTGSLVGRQKVTGLPLDERWHTFEVTVNQSHILVSHDGQPCLAYDDPHPLGRGFIGLQHNSGRAAFRNVKLRPLNTKALFNGRDLTGWKPLPGLPAEFQVAPAGELRVHNGPGQLETDSVYGDFVLQLEGFSHGEKLNSGIFFRSIPGEKMNGYETQIYHGYDSGDRTKPSDQQGGTGAIFRRADARRVMPDDQEWFCLTLVAEGPHLAVWVNGYQVTDFVDRRPPDANPRRGLRLEPGSILLQAHDAATDYSFRKLRLAEMAPRRP